MYSFSTENWSRSPDEVAGADGDVRAADRGRDPRAARRGRADALHRPPERRRSPPALVEAMEWAERADRRQRADHAVRGLQLRRQGGDRRRGANLPGGDRGGVPRPSLRPGHARPRSDHPHQRRAPHLQLPAVAGGLRRARVPRRAVAGFRHRGLRANPAGVRRSPAAVRGRDVERRTSDLLARVLVAVPACVRRDRVHRSRRSHVRGVHDRRRASCTMHELYRLLERWRPVDVVGFASLAGMALAARYGVAARRARGGDGDGSGGCSSRCSPAAQRGRRDGRDRRHAARGVLDRSRVRPRRAAAPAAPRQRDHHRRPGRHVPRRHRRLPRRAAVRAPTARSPDLAQQDGRGAVLRHARRGAGGVLRRALPGLADPG